MTMLVIINVTYIQNWRDYQLTWNETEFDGVSTIAIPASSLWTPDILLYNRSDVLFSDHVSFSINQLIFTVA